MANQTYYGPKMAMFGVPLRIHFNILFALSFKIVGYADGLIILLPSKGEI